MPKYYIVERQHLGYWGHENGYDSLEEINDTLAQTSPDDADELVVIKGEELAVVFKVMVESDE